MAALTCAVQPALRIHRRHLGVAGEIGLVRPPRPARSPNQIGAARDCSMPGHMRRGRRWERMAPSYPRTLFAYFLLFAALYAGFGVQSPYLPRLLQENGLRAETIGVVLAAGTAIRLAAGPIAGSIADRLDAPTLVFAGCAAGAALTSLGYLAASGFWPIFAVTLLQASALAPLA